MPQIASLEDRPERAESCHVIAFGSPFHRCTGKLIRLEKPGVRAHELVQFLEDQKADQLEVGEASFGWSDEFVDRSTNGGTLPSCWLCRRARLLQLGHSTSNRTTDIVITTVSGHRFHDECTDWEISDKTASLLKFSPPDDCPSSFDEDCPVDPPSKRKPGLTELECTPMTSGLAKQACRVAHHHSSLPQNCWAQDVCFEHLRVCGVPKKE